MWSIEDVRVARAATPGKMTWALVSAAAVVLAPALILGAGAWAWASLRGGDESPAAADVQIWGQPIGAVNAIIGDSSFEAMFGGERRAADAPEALRIATHLAFVEAQLRARVAFVEAQLRARDVGDLPADLVRARRLNLDRLGEYRRTGLFPAGDDPSGRLPTFVDDRGRRCAVAYLVERSLGPDAVVAINRRFRNAYLAQIDDARFSSWVARSGLTLHELATIQPTYNFLIPIADRSAQLTGTYQHSLGASGANETSSLLGLAGEARRLGLRRRGLNLALALDGWAARGTGSSFAYRSAARAGFAGAPGGGDGILGILVGAGIEGLTGTLDPALIVPVQAFFEAAGQAWRLRARVEAAPALLGRRNLDGWLVGADLVRHHGGIHVGYWGADLVLSATLRRFADALFTGVAIGVGTSKRTQRYLFDDIDPHAVR